MDLAGKKAIVFGGTSGIGLATVQQLATAGAEVIAVSRNPDKAGDPPAGVTLRACDVLDRDGIAALFAACAPYDIVISAATGGKRAFGPFTEMDMDGYQGCFDKLWGYANVVRYGTEHLSDTGSIVLVSGSPARRPLAGQAGLATVGAAVETLVRSVAPEIAPKRINVVSPGLVNTPQNTMEEGAARDAHFAKATSNFLITRAGQADEIADAIMFLVGNEFATGTTVDVDGGWLLS